MSWPAEGKRVKRLVNDSIPTEWRISPELLARYPAGSDIRPLAHTSGVLSPRELSITDTSVDATSLVEQLHSSAISAEEAVTAFAKRAAVAHQAVTCLAGFYYEDALKKAKELDAILKSTGKPVGPLHGLPISVKSNNRVKGQISSAGFSTTEVSESTSHLIQILLDAGAIVYCRTTLPQAIMALECLSFWGETLNPLNTKLSPGGSSGGCSALMAFGGSPMSFGSDIGGSLRQPSACVGLWTLKSTVGRIPKSNSYRVNAGYDTIAPVVGPQCRSLRDLNLICKIAIDSKPWLREHSIIPLPWCINSQAKWSGQDNRIRVGFMESDGVIRPQPPIIRGIRRLVEALKQNERFEVVEYEPFDHQRGSDIATASYFPDGGAMLYKTAEQSGEALLPLTQWAVTRPNVKDHTVHELWDLNNARDMYRAEYLAYWQTLKLDVVIGPAQPQTAPQMGTSKYWGYTSVYNLLEWPAAVFPTGLMVDTQLDLKEATFKSTNELEQLFQDIYEPESYANTPICLQAVGSHYEDEKLLEALRIIKQEVLPLK